MKTKQIDVVRAQLETLHRLEQFYRPQDEFTGHNISKRRARLLKTYHALRRIPA